MGGNERGSRERRGKWCKGECRVTKEGREREQKREREIIIYRKLVYTQFRIFNKK